MTPKSMGIKWNVFFWGMLIASTLYIATISAPGIYYDYHLITEYPLIAKLNYGGISVEDFISQLSSFEREIKFSYFGGGRFHPLYLVDLVFIVKLFGSVKWAWAYEATLFLVFMATLYRTTARLISNEFVAGLAVLLLFFHPGFWYVWTTLASTTEAQTIAFLSLSMFFYMRFSDNGTFVNAALCAGSMAIALCYKEPTFIAVGVFAGIHALLIFRSDNNRLIRLDCLLLVTVGLVFIWYFAVEIWPLLKNGIGETGLYFQMKSRGEGTAYGLHVIIPHLKTYARTDPFLVFLLLPLACVHFVQLAIRPSSAKDKLVAAFFAGGVIWLLQYIAIGVSDAHFQYYAIPAYVFAVPALAAKFTEIFSSRQEVKGESDRYRRHIKTATVILIIIAVWPSKTYRPGAMDWILNNRFDNKHWAMTIDKAADIVRQTQQKKTYFYFYKSPRSSTIELHESFTAFMVAKGLLPKDFDLTYSSNDNIAWSGHAEGVEFGTPEVPWSWRHNYRARAMQTGDYLIVNSWWPFSSNDEIEKVQEDFELVFGTSALYGCETLSLGHIWRYLKRSARIFTFNSLPTVAEALFSEARLKETRLYQTHGLCSPITNNRNFYIFKKKP